MHDPVRCVGVGDKPSRSQWLAITGGEIGGRTWVGVGAGGWTRLPSTPGLPSMLLGYHLCETGEAVDCLLSAQTACKAYFNGKEESPTSLFQNRDISPGDFT